MSLGVISLNMVERTHSNTKNTYTNMEKELQSEDKYVCKRFKDCWNVWELIIHIQIICNFKLSLATTMQS